MSYAGPLREVVMIEFHPNCIFHLSPPSPLPLTFQASLKYSRFVALTRRCSSLWRIFKAVEPGVKVREGGMNERDERDERPHSAERGSTTMRKCANLHPVPRKYP